jgi:hypothetical protein
MVDFKTLKKNSSSLDKLNKAIADTQKQSYSKDDDRFWQPDVDKAGNGYAEVRILDAPAVDGEDALPWVRLFNHGFQGAAGWYIENCPTTVNGKCPACEHNSTLWNSGIEANKEIVRKQKRRLTYITNIMVIVDAKHPENEGKVFLWKFGKKIFDKIDECIHPPFDAKGRTPDDAAYDPSNAFNPTSFWKGANLKIKIRNVEGYRNYDKSEFDAPAPILEGNDKEIEKLWNSLPSLKQFVAPDQFKSYDELSDKLSRTLGSVGKARAAVAVTDESAPWVEPRAAAPKARKTAETVDVGDDMDYFDKLAAE